VSHRGERPRIRQQEAFAMTRVSVPAVVIALAAAGTLATVRLQPETVEGWNRYVTAVEARRARELRDAGRALVMDATASGVAERHSLRAGALVVKEMPAPSHGGEIDVPSGMVHHWRGAVFLPGVSLAALMTRLKTEAPPPSPEVVRSSILERSHSGLKVFLRLKRTKIVTAVYDTEHDIRFFEVSPVVAASTSIATRISEIDEPGTPGERALPAGDDRGFLWRLNAYWRYEAVEGGVIAECESISLSRAVPFGLGAIAGPIVRSTARESMERTLESLREMSRP
jgi:hypothetical protein